MLWWLEFGSPAEAAWALPTRYLTSGLERLSVKTRGTRSGIVVSLDADDTAGTLRDALGSQRDLLSGKVFIEITERVPWSNVEAVLTEVEAAEGTVVEVRPPSAVVQAKGETVIVARTVRSGARVESSGSVIVIGDVNAGSEIIAEDDIIVLGTLRGVAHAGANGNEKAMIWAQHILSKQLRIGNALAQADGGSKAATGPEVAQLHEGQIMLRPWDR